MLELKNIRREYLTGDFLQVALKDINVNFRRNEFAAILGPSGSGKTTLLNIIGGLDKYTSGDLIINEISTKKYKERDWDSYRNHRIGFIFQSYNLIGHQSILSNVEIALTISGVSKKERRERAKAALEEVGLSKHIHKRPNELSGGQMQRVAIARALVNNPDILLADEPTGALDTETSIEIMNLLQKIAEDKLVIMVTHNPELANVYANRIINIKDGEITDDSNPYNGKVNTKEDESTHKKHNKKTSMSFFTALSLSLNNLMTKKGRTLLTSFAGSIGIIGIALILSLSNGLQTYIDTEQKNTVSSYPVAVQENNIDITGMMTAMTSTSDKKCSNNKLCITDDVSSSPYVNLNQTAHKNDLTSFKKYIEENKKELEKFSTDIVYDYDLSLEIYKEDGEEFTKVNPYNTNSTIMMGGDNSNLLNTDTSTLLLNNAFSYDSTSVLKDKSKYKLIKGRMAKDYNELLLIVDNNGNIGYSVAASLGLVNVNDFKNDVNNKLKDKDYNIEEKNIDLDSIVGTKYKILTTTDYYEKNGDIYINKEDSTSYIKEKLKDAEELEIVGILKINDEDSLETSHITYLDSLNTYLINKVSESDIYKDQVDNKEHNYLTGDSFNDNFKYEDVIKTLGIVFTESPSTINIYPKDFNSKQEIEDFINDYNETVDDDKKIEYTDTIATLMESITNIVNIISYVLIAFVAISLVVSSIMIAIITYISVLERTKEIGILKSLGASRKDIRRVFNAETVIEGLISGTLGVVLTLGLNVIISNIIYSAINVKNIAVLPVNSAFILILISTILTLISGLVPANIASKRDAVTSLRSE